MQVSVRSQQQMEQEKRSVHHAQAAGSRLSAPTNIRHKHTPNRVRAAPHTRRAYALASTLLLLRPELYITHREGGSGWGRGRGRGARAPSWSLA